MQGSNIVDNGDKAMKVVSKNDSITVISAIDNYWGTTDSAMIEELIVHNADISSVPLVVYVPYALDTFDIGATSPTDVKDENNIVLPEGFALEQNYPNPFNPSTKIEFTIPNRASVELTIFNVLGQQINKLLNTDFSAGIHYIEWQGDDSYGRPVPTGVYFYRLQVEDFTETRKMVLLK